MWFKISLLFVVVLSLHPLDAQKLPASVPDSPHPHPQLYSLVFVSLFYCDPSGCEVTSRCGFGLAFPCDQRDAERPSPCWAVCDLLEGISVGSSAVIKLGCLSPQCKACLCGPSKSGLAPRPTPSSGGDGEEDQEGALSVGSCTRRTRGHLLTPALQGLP